MRTAFLTTLRPLLATGALLLAASLLPGTAQAQSAPLPDIQAIAAGAYHTCALTTGGGVKCWGGNDYGQLGDGSTTQWLTPVDVSGLTSGVVAIAAGGRHTCALTTGGGVKCWGRNNEGQLGDGSTTGRLIPVDVSGLSSGVVAIAAWGGRHTCALTTGGGLKCWGWNDAGQLGDNSTTDRLTPVNVSGLSSGVAAIAVGNNHTCALTGGGGMKCWGMNSDGQLGDNSETDRLTPVDVSGLTSGVAAITAGGRHTCALTAGGGMKCWGDNYHGQVGDGGGGDYIVSLAPVDVSGLTSGVAAISAGDRHTCARTTGGGVKCWGNNDYAQLGDNSRYKRLTPVDVSGLSSGVGAIAAGGVFTCALTTGGGVKCWGSNSNGQRGNDSTPIRLTPVDVSGLTSGVAAISAGDRHTCARTTGGGVKCWGNNESGQLGDNSTTLRLTPVDVAGLTSGVAAIAVGGYHTCALTTGGGVKCWGNNDAGQLGDNGAKNRPTPVDVSGLTSGVAAIAAGRGHTCALTTGGGMKCWGAAQSSQLGDNVTTWFSRIPVDVSGLSSGVAAIAAGGAHTCALTAGGGVKCWGDNGRGQLGDYTETDRRTPVDVAYLANGVAAIAAGSEHTCALTTGGGMKCWGSNWQGQIGDNGNWERIIPVDVSGLTSGVAAIAAGSEHTCALTTGGGGKCWGWNGYGQLGDNTQTKRLTPVDVSGLSSGVAAIGAGGTHTCALTTGGGAKCWGNNWEGQLGDGTGGQRPVDVLIVAPDAPTGLVATAGIAQIGIAFNVPAYNGGGAIDQYRATCGGQSANGSASPIVVSGLANGTYYTCTVAAHNAAGWSADSLPSASVSPGDTVPDPFTFTPVSGVSPGTWVTSDPVTIAGIDTSVPIRVTGGSYSVNGGAFTSAEGTLTNGQSVRAQVRSAAGFGGTATATVTVGSGSADFTVTTHDGANPLPFAFATVRRAAPGSAVESEAVVLSGFAGSKLASVSGGLLSVDGGAWADSGTVLAGSSVRVRIVAASNPGRRVTATVSVGATSGQFTAITRGGGLGGVLLLLMD